jgi:hypothetical protein
MSDSNERDALAAKHERNREQRIEAVKRGVEYIREHPAEEWGAQQNRLVKSQIESAQASGLDVEHRRRVDDAGRDR